MPDDKLTRAERVRLEAFAQAVNSSFTLRNKITGDTPSLVDLFTQAEKIEAWLKAANPN